MKKGILVAVAFVCLIMSPAALADANSTKRGKLPMVIADNSGHMCPAAAGGYAKNFESGSSSGAKTTWAEFATKSNAAKP